VKVGIAFWPGGAEQIQHSSEDLQVGIIVTEVRRVHQPRQVKTLIKTREKVSFRGISKS
jgi:hypothetical protein